MQSFSQALDPSDGTSPPAAPDSTVTTVVERGPSYRVIETVTNGTDPETGEPVQSASRYTELADGMHYWDGAQWAESQDLIEIAGDHAVAQRGPSKVLFSGNLNVPGAIDLTTAGGVRLRSQPLGLYYFDRSSGKIVALAAVRDCAATLYPPNRLAYDDAMDSLSASVIYVYAKNGFEQNILLKQRPPTPEQLGLNGDSTSLQVWTEFLNPPKPSIRKVILPFVNQKSDGSDSAAEEDLLDFGDLVFPVGKAFSFTPPDPNAAKEPATVRVSSLQDGDAPVAKQWITTDAGRTILVESVNYRDIEPQLKQLQFADTEAPKIEPLPLLNRSGFETSAPVLLAEKPFDSRGVVLDYTTLSGYYGGTYTFSSGTYFISGPVTINSTATFQSGTILKYGGTSCYLLLYVAPSFPASGTMPVFTSTDDDTVGDLISGSTHSPGYIGTFLNFYYLPTSCTVNNSRFRYATTAVQNGGGTATHTVTNCFFERCQTGVINTGGTVTLSNDKKCLLATDTSGSGAFSGSFTLDCIGIENAWPGDGGWSLNANSVPVTPGWPTNSGDTTPEIEGFASLTSVNVGSSISFYVDVRNSDPSFKIQIFRMGWYGGAGARKMMWYDSGSSITQKTLTSVKQPFTYMSTNNGVIDCLATSVDGVTRSPWTSSYTLTVPTGWLSGVYLVKLTTIPTSGTGKASYIIFTVREDSRASDLLFQNSVTTWQAYNPWGGNSAYPYPYVWDCGFATTGNSLKSNQTVSFNRPYAGTPCDAALAWGSGAGEFLTMINVNPQPAWEYNALRWMEKQGYDMTYCTSIDTHQGYVTNSTKAVKAFLSVGHDEYWSQTMRDAVTAARDRTSNPINLVFFGANACYWQIHFTSDYRSFTNNKISNADLFRLTTGHEVSLIGVEYVWNDDGKLVLPITFKQSSSDWTYQYSSMVDSNSVVTNTTTLSGLLGFEVDGCWTNSTSCQGQPSGSCVAQCVDEPQPYCPTAKRLAESTFFTNQVSNCLPNGAIATNIAYSYVTVYTNSPTSSAKVFATGTLRWAWGLDDYGYTNVGRYSTSKTNGIARQMTDNVLRTFTGKSRAPLP